MLTWPEFRRIVKIAEAAAMQPTTKDQKAACRPIGKLSAQDKVEVVAAFCVRAAKLHRKGGGDWAAWIFVAAYIGPREVLPWYARSVDVILMHVAKESRALPPELVVRMVKQYIAANGALTRRQAKLVERVATSMWPDDDAEGANFKKAAAKLRALI